VNLELMTGKWSRLDMSWELREVNLVGGFVCKNVLVSVVGPALLGFLL
jgi:hypothetical protein